MSNWVVSPKISVPQPYIKSVDNMSLGDKIELTIICLLSSKSGKASNKPRASPTDKPVSSLML